MTPEIALEVEHDNAYHLRVTYIIYKTHFNECPECNLQLQLTHIFPLKRVAFSIVFHAYLI